jgi:hypothetical protein
MDRYPIVPFTGAPWPSWAKTSRYSEGYFDRYEKRSMSASEIESFFMSFTHDYIPNRYLTNVGMFLSAIHHVIRTRRDGNGHHVQCNVLSIQSIVCVPEEKSIIVHNILVRPCVWGLGFFQLTLLQLIISSLYMGMSLWILNPTDEMILELKRISSKFHDDKDKEKDDDGNVLKFMILDKKDMGNAVREIVSKNHLAKGHKNGVVVLNENYKFPSFNDLNNPKWVNNKNNHIIH